MMPLIGIYRDASNRAEELVEQPDQRPTNPLDVLVQALQTASGIGLVVLALGSLYIVASTGASVYVGAKYGIFKNAEKALGKGVKYIP